MHMPILSSFHGNAMFQTGFIDPMFQTGFIDHYRAFGAERYQIALAIGLR